MSRSVVQDSILSHLSDSQQVERQELRWRVAKQLNRIPAASTVGKHQEAKLLPSFTKSFDRALSTLKKNGAITYTEWTPASFQEFIDAYCFRTDSTLVRKIRERLLPELLATLPNGPATRISVEDVEQRFVRTKLATASLRKAQSSWSLLQTRIAQASLPAHEFTACASVVIAANRLLHPPSWGTIIATGSYQAWTGVSLDHAISQLSGVASTPMGQALATDLRVFYEGLIPISVRKRGDLKNALYEFLNVERHGTSALKEEALWNLHRRATDYVESLPGHHGSVPTLPRFARRNLPTYSPYLADHLLDRIALRKFTRISSIPTH